MVPVLLVVGDLARFDIQEVYKDGQRVAEHGKPLFAPPATQLSAATNTVKTGTIAPEKLRIHGHAGDVAIIGIEAGQITTLHLTEPAPVHNGEIVPDVSRDL